MREVVGRQGERRLSKIGMEQMMVSLGHQACGALSLWNYPSWMRNVVPQDVDGKDRPDSIDMAALESNMTTHLISFALLYQRDRTRTDAPILGQFTETGREVSHGTTSSEETC